MINYSIISEAIDFYTQNGFKYIETPWIVPDEVSKITSPVRTGEKFALKDGILVGSAEQGFLDLIINGDLNPGKYVSCGPCFRDEMNLDDCTLETFLKVELIEYLPDDPTFKEIEQGLAYVKNCAFEFMSLYSKGISIHLTDDGIDTSDITICHRDRLIELGSYGLRHYCTEDRDISWIYGTGVAEPRFSRFVFKPGYHNVPIPKYPTQTAEKLLEEAREYLDACRQNNTIMAMCELSDVYLVVRQLAELHGLTISDVAKMANATENAFLSGRR